MAQPYNMVTVYYYCMNRRICMFLLYIFPDYFVIIPPANFVEGILFSRCPCVRPCVRPSVCNVLFLKYLEESLMDFHQTLQTCSYMQDIYFRQNSKG